MLLSRFSLFKTPRPRSFGYRPMYYRPESDSELLNQEKTAAGIGQESYIAGRSIRNQIEARRNRQYYHTLYENSRRRVFTLLVAIVLAAIIWFML